MLDIQFKNIDIAKIQKNNLYAYGSSNLTGEEKLKLTQEYDSIKNQWCLENNIPLIRIPYTQYKDLNIKDLLLETSKFIIKGENND